MTATPSSDTANLHGGALIDAAFANEFAAPIADAPAPSPEDAAARADDTPAADAETPEATAPAETPAPEKAPAVLTLTPEELQAKIDEATKRARADQSRMAKELREARAAAQARQEALNKLQQDASERYLDRTAIIEEQFRAQNYANQLLTQDEEAENERANAGAQLAAAKEQMARTDYLDAMSTLMEEAGPLGMKRDKVNAILEEIAKTDKLAASYVAEFDTAATPQAAQAASQRLYLVLTDKATVRLQAEKMAEIAETAPPKPRIERPQVHGSGGTLGADPYRNIKNWGERGRNRLDAAFADWAKTQTE